MGFLLTNKHNWGAPPCAHQGLSEHVLSPVSKNCYSGWWFGCHFLNFPMNIGNLIIPTDELIFFRGVAQPPTRLLLYTNNFQIRMIRPNIILYPLYPQV